MKSLFQDFVIELWPMWVGIGIGLIYYLLRKFLSICKGATKILEFDEKLNELGVERRKLMTHVHNSYNRIEVKLDNSHNALSDRLDKIERQINSNHNI